MMKYAVVAAVVVLPWLWHSANAADALEGQPAPALESTQLDGNKFSLAAQSGKVVLIHYWATWCIPCREEMPVFEAYYKAHQNEGLVMLAVSMDEPEDLPKVKEVMKTFSFPATLGAYTKAKGYGRIWRIPLTFVIDRQGILRKNGWYGDVALDQAGLDKSVTPLLK
jgi:cytochrome c biogenesis protein CcmG/thiol:disulfide interchange protein DsbE